MALRSDSRDNLTTEQLEAWIALEIERNDLRAEVERNAESFALRLTEADYRAGQAQEALEALRAERDDLIREFGQFKNEQRAFRSKLYNERDALRAENEHVREALNTELSVHVQQENALHAEIERLKASEMWVTDAWVPKSREDELLAENERLKEIDVIRSINLGRAEQEIERLNEVVRRAKLAYKAWEEVAHEKETENERLRAVVEAAKQFREARVATMTYGWNAHEQEAQAMQALMEALVALDGTSQS